MSARSNIGVNAWVWDSPFTRDSTKLFEKAVAMGFDAFTIPLEEPALIDVDAIRTAISEHPLRLYATGAFGPSRDLTHEDPRFRKESLDYIEGCLKICAQLGIATLVGPCYSAVGKCRKIPDAQRKLEWDLAVKGISQAGKMASDYGVTLAVEPLKRFETDLINTAEQVKRLIREIDQPPVKINLDTFHMHIEDKSI